MSKYIVGELNGRVMYLSLGTGFHVWVTRVEKASRLIDRDNYDGALRFLRSRSRLKNIRVADFGN